VRRTPLSGFFVLFVFAVTPAFAASPARLRVTDANIKEVHAIGPAISFVVRNIGDRRAASATVRVYLSKDPKYSTDDRRVLTMHLPRIAGHHHAGRITNWDWQGNSGYKLVCVTARGQARSCRSAT